MDIAISWFGLMLTLVLSPDGTPNELGSWIRTEGHSQSVAVELSSAGYENPNEFGGPVPSWIPYLDRRFKNVGYGKDTSSLLLMVTPRIIINAEEEERQTGLQTGGPGGTGPVPQ